jgi:hypothetical protein
MIIQLIMINFSHTGRIAESSNKLETVKQALGIHSANGNEICDQGGEKNRPPQIVEPIDRSP